MKSDIVFKDTQIPHFSKILMIYVSVHVSTELFLLSLSDARQSQANMVCSMFF
jgi:hypothetical protein